MMAKLKAEPSEIRRFMDEITRGWSDLDGNPMIEVRALAENSAPNTARFSLDWIDDAAEHAQTMNDAGRNVYMCINPVDGRAGIKAGKGAHDEDILAAFYCFADADTDGAMKNILSFAGPQFTMSVKTGTTPFVRGHCYWRLEDPVQNLQAWRDTQQSIAHSLKTDEVVINPSRIMRVAGTVSWPSAKKVAKGYKPELVTMRTEFSTDRDPVPFERMMRAFPRVGKATAPSAEGFSIDLGKQAMDRALAQQAIMQGDDWHHNVVRLVGSYVAKGLADAEIHAITDNFTQPPYTVEDTRREVQQAIDGAREKGWTPKPDPVADRMQAQNHAMSIALEPEQPDQPQQEDAKAQGEWPTPYDMFDASILPRREWIYGYDYIKKYISVTASAGGIGKTSAIIVEALAIASGKPLLGTAVKSQENTWVINLEDPMSEMQMRTIAAMKHHDLKPSEVKGKLFMDGEDTMSITLAAEGRDGLITNDALIEHMTKKIKANNIGVVIIDPFVSTHLVNENNNGSVQAVVSMLRKLARDTNTSIMLVHHIRKTNGEDATVDSVRGAVSLIGAARAARVINRITPEDAMALGVNENESRGIFRIDDGKANLAPPSDKAVYRQMVSVEIANGEHIGVATEFKLPDLFDGVTAKDLYKVQRTVGEAEQNDDAYRSDVRAKNWIGVAVAEQLGLDLDKPGDKARAKAIAKKWISTNALKVENIASKRHGREVPCVIVGEWVDWAEVQ